MTRPRKPHWRDLPASEQEESDMWFRFAFKSMVLLLCVLAAWALRRVSGEYPGFDDGYSAGALYVGAMVFFMSPLLDRPNKADERMEDDE